MHSEELFEVAINWAKKRGFKKIKANTEDFDTPSAFNREGKDPVIPDLTGMQTSGKSYVEIACKVEDVQGLISKWKLLSTMAQVKGGKLYLLAPRGHKAFTENIVKDYNLEARIISI
ncbi:MAG: hypothetical protein ACI8YQ_001948 [Polaribacter sp.]|jgi:hypothetical protein